MSGTNEEFNGNEYALMQQARVVQDFFRTDSAAEMIGSLNAITESVLFSTDLEYVTVPMRTDMVNQLRVVTLLARLSLTNVQIKI